MAAVGGCAQCNRQYRRPSRAAAGREVRALLGESAAAILAADLPQPGEVFPRPVSWRIFAEDAGVYEALLHASMALFKDRGYSETSMAQIAKAAGVPVSGIYRYFSGKCEILTTGLRRAADRVSGQLSPVVGALTEPRQALTLLIDAYVATSFANPELAAVYYTERANLTPADQTLLHNVQLSTIDSWVRLLTAARPSLTATQARFLVHAAMALVVDLGRMVEPEVSADQSAYLQACVRKLMEVTLFGHQAGEAPPQPPAGDVEGLRAQVVPSAGDLDDLGRCGDQRGSVAQFGRACRTDPRCRG